MAWGAKRRSRGGTAGKDGGPAPTHADLVALGAETLATLLLERAGSDADLFDRLRLMVAARSGPDRFVSAMTDRIRALAEDHTFYEWDEAVTLAVRVDDLRHTIANEFLRQAPRTAANLLGALANTSDLVMERVDDSSGEVGMAYDEVVDAWGAAWAAVEDRDPEAVASLVFHRVVSEKYGVGSNLLPAFGAALGHSGHRALRQLIETRLGELPAGGGTYWRDILHRALRQVADALGDVDAFIASLEADGRPEREAVAVAVRLVVAARAEEALAWLGRATPAEQASERGAAAHIDALLALGRPEEAQVIRWRQASEHLRLEAYRAFLQGRPDTEREEAHGRVVEAALANADACGALAFLIDLPNLEAAERLVVERLGAFDGRLYFTLVPLAARLEADRPLAAALLYHRLAEAVLDARRSAAYHHAADYVCTAARLAAAIADWRGHESHAAFMVRLRDVHRRKSAFWPALASAERVHGRDEGTRRWP